MPRRKFQAGFKSGGQEGCDVDRIAENYSRRSDRVDYRRAGLAVQVKSDDRCDNVKHATLLCRRELVIRDRLDR
jgi:hypothetical protein